MRGRGSVKEERGTSFSNFVSIILCLAVGYFLGRSDGHNANERKFHNELRLATQGQNLELRKTSGIAKVLVHFKDGKAVGYEILKPQKKDSDVPTGLEPVEMDLSHY